MTLRTTLLAAGCASLTFAAGVQAQEAEPGGGFSFDAAYTADFWSNTRGGLAEGERFLDNLDLILGFEGAGVLENVTATMHVLHNNGGAFSEDLVGDAQVVTNIEAGNEATRLYELWIARSFAEDRAGVKLGLQDLNADFDIQETGGLFLNSSHGIGPDFSQSGLNGPSIFPVTAVALTGFVRPSEGWTLKLGAFDGVPGDPELPRRTTIRLNREEGALLVAEGERRFGETGRAALGVWGYTAKFDAMSRTDPDGEPVQLRGNQGLYGIVEGRVMAEAGTDDQGLNLWARAGFADEDVNAIGRYFGGGAAYTGLIPGRDADQAGLAIGQARFGQGAKDSVAAAGGLLEGSETTVEVTYRIALTDWLAVQPDVQYIVNPAGDPSVENAVAAGVRFELGWSR